VFYDKDQFYLTELKSMSLKRNNKINDYIERLFAVDYDLEHQFIHPSMKHIQIGATEGKLIYLICKLRKVTKVLEFGSFYGYSTAWIAKSLPENGIIYSFECNPCAAYKAEKNMHRLNLNHKVQIINKIINYKSISDIGSSFDCIFIDGKKSEYLYYLELADKFLSTEGLLIADNVLMFDQIYNTELNRDLDGNMKKNSINSIQSFNKSLAERYDSVIIPNCEGLAIGIKK
jgi:predicted O-methyltransferase YrrM